MNDAKLKIQLSARENEVIRATACRLFGDRTRIRVFGSRAREDEKGGDIKARAKLGWHPRWNLPTTLGSTIHWHKQMLLSDNIPMVSLQQIADYQSRIHP